MWLSEEKQYQLVNKMKTIKMLALFIQHFSFSVKANAKCVKFAIVNLKTKIPTNVVTT